MPTSFIESDKTQKTNGMRVKRIEKATNNIASCILTLFYIYTHSYDVRPPTLQLENLSTHIAFSDINRFRFH